MVSGIHHVTLVTRRVQANVDFYAGFLGLRIVKQTGGFEDGEQLHLFYGDGLGSPGSLVTFLVWEDGAPGRVGHGQVAEVAFAVPPQAIGDWLARAISYRIPHDALQKEFGETVLRLKDPDGVTVKLVAAPMTPATAWTETVPEDAAITRLRSVTLFSEMPEQTEAFLARFGYRIRAEEAGVRRLQSDTDAIDIRDASGFFPGIPGTGTADHVALRAPDNAAVTAMEKELARLNATETNVHDRLYFTSLYVREPSGTLIEYATDGPGFLVDEPAETLGTELMIPPADRERDEDLRAMLPQFAVPGAPRPPRRDLPFVHRINEPADPDGSTLILLHGTGGNEADLMPFARGISPQSLLIGVRGRSTEEGTLRWFRRSGPTEFDQGDIRAEAEAFAAFLEGAVRGYALDPRRLTCLGYSNGANLLGATLLLHPGSLRRAILLRGMAVLSDPPQPVASPASVLLLSGVRDPYAAHAQALVGQLRASGAEVADQTVDAGHELTQGDRIAAERWLTDHP